MTPGRMASNGVGGQGAWSEQREWGRATMRVGASNGAGGQGARGTGGAGGACRAVLPFERTLAS